jgi:hypothetical protein
MNILKRICLLGAITFLTFSAALPTQAQFFGGLAGAQSLLPFASTNYNTTNSAITGAWNYVYPLPGTGATTNATFPRIDVSNGRLIAFTLSMSGTTNTATGSLSLIRSIDGNLWETTPFALLSVSAATGASTQYSTNLDIGAFRFVTALAWTNSAGVSNAACWYGIKPGF